MCCFFTTLVLLGPRFAALIWWLINPIRWQLAFDSAIWPILGVLLVPWTTIMYVIVSPGGVTGFDWFWIGLAVISDIGMYLGGGYGNRERVPV